MRIGIVCYPTYGGSGVVATELGKALADKGHEVHFITYSQPVRLDIYSENLFYHEVHVPDYPLFDFLPYELALTSKLVDVIKFERLEILHVHYAIPHAYAAFMAKQILGSTGINLPIITTLHGTDITLVGRNPSYKPAVTFSINQSDLVTSVSESLKKDTLDFFDVKKEIEVIPNFVDLSLYRGLDTTDIRHRFGKDSDRLLCHVSNFRKVKRVGDVIEIFAKVRQKIPSKLLMIGDGPERESAEQLCRKLKICDDVFFLGKTKAVEKILAVTDLFVLPSETESFGLAALEAMAAGVPVISTNTGGLPEVIDHGVVGFTSNVGDVQDMARNALKILTEDEDLQKFKHAALSHAETFGMDYILPKYEALYASVL